MFLEGVDEISLKFYCRIVSYSYFILTDYGRSLSSFLKESYVAEPFYNKIIDQLIFDDNDELDLIIGSFGIECI